jgi:hypothetical protein
VDKFACPESREGIAKETRSNDPGKSARHQDFRESESDAEPSQTFGEPPGIGTDLT